MSAYAQLATFAHFADRYLDIRRANPDLSAGSVVAYLQAIDGITVDDIDEPTFVGHYAADTAIGVTA